MLLSILGFAGGLEGVEVADIVLVRTVRTGDELGLILTLLAVDTLGFSKRAELDDATPLEAAAGSPVGLSVASGSALRLLKAVTGGRGRAGLSPGLSFRCANTKL